MAATSGEGPSRIHEYEVFLSFRGPDTRDTFTDCLYHSLIDNGVVVFRDSEDLHVGEKIEELLRAVTNSRICIPVLSKGYASSAWCLRELELMSSHKESTGSLEILPIFFDVTPEDVKVRTETYVNDLNEHKKKHDDHLVEKWKEALQKVAKIKGWEVKDQGYGELIKAIVEKVVMKLKKKEKEVTDLVGIDEQVDAVMKKLDVDSGGVRFVGILGMGGIGKTTLVRKIFNDIYGRFDKCSFVDDVRESSKEKRDLLNLQKKVLCDLCNRSRVDDKITDIDEGRSSIQRILGCKKVLIVLDDIDKEEQLKNLVGCPDSLGFDSGSRVLITTRDKNTLAHVEGILIYEVEQLDREKALRLFSMCAFESRSPPYAYYSLSEQIVSKTGGLPLTLKVIGSHLYKEDSVEIWKETLNMLSEIPFEEIREQLVISYNALKDNEKRIFLDIACIFIHESETIAVNAWEACGLYPRSGIKILIQKSLIKVTMRNTIWMHDQLRDLGRNIVCKESLSDMTGRSRFWNYEDVLDIVRSEKRKDKVEALSLAKACSEPIFIKDEEFNKFPNLKFLELTQGTFVGDFINHISKLRCLYWHYPPLDCRLTNFHLKDLVRFELSNCEATEDWGGWSLLKMANKLKVLVLWGCNGLKRTPYLTGCVGLERLSIQKCSKVQTIDSTVGKLKKLTSLEIHGCENFQSLPEEIGGLMKLECLSLRELDELIELPHSIGKLESLCEFNIPFQEIDSLPDSIGNARKLSILNLSHTLIDELPDSFGELKGLESLSLKGCKHLRELPKSIGNLTSLKKLNVSHTKIVELPTTIGRLQRLEELYAYNCGVLKQLPTEISGLTSLRILDLSNTLVHAVPSISSLTSLRELDLTDCNEVRDLPELPSSLNFLYVRSLSLHSVPDLSSLTNLVDLLISDGSGKACFRAPNSNPMQTSYVQWIGRLSKLKKLELCISDTLSLSAEPCCLPQLTHLLLCGVDMHGHLLSSPSESQLDRIKSMAPSLKRLDLSCILLDKIHIDGLELLRYLIVEDCELLEELSILSSLRKLEEIKVSSCPKLVEIEILGRLESLKTLSVDSCASFERLNDASKVTEQVSLFVRGCNKLRDTWQFRCKVPEPLSRKSWENYETESFNSLESLRGLSDFKKQTSCYDERYPGLLIYNRLYELKVRGTLSVSDYGKLEGLLDVPSTKITDEYKIKLRKCLKLIDSGSDIPWALLMEMIFLGSTDPELKKLEEELEIKWHEKESIVEIEELEMKWKKKHQHHRSTMSRFSNVPRYNAMRHEEFRSWPPPSSFSADNWRNSRRFSKGW